MKTTYQQPQMYMFHVKIECQLLSDSRGVAGSSTAELSDPDAGDQLAKKFVYEAQVTGYDPWED
ncbi:MAG: hypothetical protein I3J02_07845 [Prevotella sp.]|nr:hypothetical protein [Prevotella sp.]